MHLRAYRSHSLATQIEYSTCYESKAKKMTKGLEAEVTAEIMTKSRKKSSKLEEGVIVAANL